MKEHWWSPPLNCKKHEVPLVMKRVLSMTNFTKATKIMDATVVESDFNTTGLTPQDLLWSDVKSIFDTKSEGRANWPI